MELSKCSIHKRAGRVESPVSFLKLITEPMTSRSVLELAIILNDLTSKRRSYPCQPWSPKKGPDAPKALWWTCTKGRGGSALAEGSGPPDRCLCWRLSTEGPKRVWELPRTKGSL